jgi:hypothetical protein
MLIGEVGETKLLHTFIPFWLGLSDAGTSFQVECPGLASFGGKNPLKKV